MTTKKKLVNRRDFLRKWIPSQTMDLYNLIMGAGALGLIIKGKRKQEYPPLQKRREQSQQRYAEYSRRDFYNKIFDYLIKY